MEQRWGDSVQDVTDADETQARETPARGESARARRVVAHRAISAARATHSLHHHPAFCAVAEGFRRVHFLGEQRGQNVLAGRGRARDVAVLVDAGGQ